MSRKDINKYCIPFRINLTNPSWEGVQGLTLNVITTVYESTSTHPVTELPDTVYRVIIESVKWGAVEVKDLVMFNDQWRNDIERAAYLNAAKVLESNTPNWAARLEEIRDALFLTNGCGALELTTPISVPSNLGFYTSIIALQVSPRGARLLAQYAPGGADNWQLVSAEDAAAIEAIQAWLREKHGQQKQEGQHG